ncbi:hypothetical protein [Caulobacter segnis]|uniref:hypothetical protein n=1 Tax=Caulobacter segnis TaxID=88688 RepID=UPI002863A4D0|nr:hypothetical protein [Caulobacter segnis]MDR6624832.1 hypothetical protein [Caulobacter segnis]
MSREKVDFSTVPIKADSAYVPSTSYVHVDGNGGEFTWRFGSVGRADLASALAAYFSPLAAEALAGLRVPTVEQYDNSWRRIARILDKRGAEQSDGFGAMRGVDLDELDIVGNYSGTRCVVHTLRLINDAYPDVLNADLKSRIKFISRHGNVRVAPREPLPKRQAEHLKESADRAVRAARVRIVAGIRERTRLELLDRPTETQRLTLKIMDGQRVGGERYPDGTAIRDVAESVVMGLYDAVAFIIAIGLRAEIPVECLKSLRRDCLKNEARGFVDIEYVKGRGGRQPRIKRERVRDGGLTTPGGLVRLALELSEPVASRLASLGHPDADYLWLGWVERCLPSWRRFSLCHKAFGRGVASFAGDAVSVDGRTTFSPARMRKTVKVERYRRTGGHLLRFATDHSVGVAARHYAAVEALADDHHERNSHS